MTRNSFKILASLAFTLSLATALAQPNGGMDSGGMDKRQRPDYSQYARYSDQHKEKKEPIYIMERYSSYAYLSYDANMLDLRLLSTDISFLMNGVSLGYTGQLHLFKTFPMFMDFGLKASYSSCNKDITNSHYKSNFTDGVGDVALLEDRLDYNINLKRFALSVPVNFGFWMNWNKEVAICPYGGVSLQLNLLADTDSSRRQTEIRIYDDGKVVSKDSKDIFEVQGNLVDGSTYGDAAWERFQMGWQVGLRADIKRRYMLGLEYGSDIITVNKKSTGERVTLRLGVAF